MQSPDEDLEISEAGARVLELERTLKAIWEFAARALAEPPEPDTGNSGTLAHICTMIEACTDAGVPNAPPCRWCAEGNPRIRSSVSNAFVHTDTPIGRRVCTEPNAAAANEHGSAMSKPYDQREEQKRIGWKAAKDRSLPMQERRQGAIRVIGAHFMRSLEDAKRRNREKEHGSLEEFVQSWLLANGDRLIEPELLSVLRTDFPPPPKTGIRMGKSYWDVSARKSPETKPTNE